MRYRRIVIGAWAVLLGACAPGLTELIRRATITATPSKTEYARTDTVSVRLRNESGEPIQIVVSHCPVLLEIATNDGGWGTAESNPPTICAPDVSRMLVLMTLLNGEEKVVFDYPIRNWMSNGRYRAAVDVYFPRDGSSRLVTSPDFALTGSTALRTRN